MNPCLWTWRGLFCRERWVSLAASLQGRGVLPPEILTSQLLVVKTQGLRMRLHRKAFENSLPEGPMESASTQRKSSIFSKNLKVQFGGIDCSILDSSTRGNLKILPFSSTEWIHEPLASAKGGRNPPAASASRSFCLHSEGHQGLQDMTQGPGFHQVNQPPDSPTLKQNRQFRKRGLGTNPFAKSPQKIRYC